MRAILDLNIGVADMMLNRTPYPHFWPYKQNEM